MVQLINQKKLFMKTNFKNPIIMGVLGVILIGSVIACSNETEDNSTAVSVDENLVVSDVNAPSSLTGACTVPSRPSGQTGAGFQTCNDVANAVNPGKLDCRVNAGYGYSESRFRFPNGSTVTYGVYKLQGDANKVQFGGTNTRVERFFNSIDRGANKVFKFDGVFQINDLSDRETNFMQAHHGGKVRSGSRSGQDATSAIWGIQATKRAGSTTKYDVAFSHTTVPFTKTNNGTRVGTFLITVDKGVEYRYSVEHGYNSSQNFVTKVTITKASDSKVTVSRTFNYTYGSDKTSFRYGSYVASPTGDRTTEIRFRGVNYCNQ